MNVHIVAAKMNRGTAVSTMIVTSSDRKVNEGKENPAFKGRRSVGVFERARVRLFGRPLDM